MLNLKINAKIDDNTANLSDKILNNVGRFLIFSIGQYGTFAEVKRKAALLETQTQRDCEAIVNHALTYTGKELIPSANQDSKTGITEVLNSHVLLEEVRKQIRLLEVLEKVEECTKLETDSVSAEPFDLDFLQQWKLNAENVHKEQLQYLWARILVKEAIQPGQFSLRTLEFIKCVSLSEAILIEKLFSLTVGWGHNHFIMKKSSQIIWDHQFGEMPTEFLSIQDMIELQHLGIIPFNENLCLHINAIETKNDFSAPLIGKTAGLLIRWQQKNQKYELPCIPLTPLGRELFQIVEVETNKAYLECIGQSMMGFERDIILFDLQKMEDGMLQGINEVKIEAVKHLNDPTPVTESL